MAIICENQKQNKNEDEYVDSEENRVCKMVTWVKKKKNGGEWTCIEWKLLENVQAK